MGGLSPPRLQVGRENEATDPSCLPTFTVNTDAGHRGIWKAFSLPAGVLLWERILCVIKSMNVHSRCQFSFLPCPCGNDILSLRFLISKMIVIFCYHRQILSVPIASNLATSISHLDQPSRILTGPLTSSLSPQPPATLQPKDLSEPLSECSVLTVMLTLMVGCSLVHLTIFDCELIFPRVLYTHQSSPRRSALWNVLFFSF